MRQVVFAGFLLTFFAGCQRPSTPPIQAAPGAPSPAIVAAPATTESPVPASVAGPMPAPTTPLPEGALVSYQCSDGNEVTVTYTYVSAHLRWPDGRELNLSRTAASNGEDVIYAGKRNSLHHNGAVMHLSLDGGTPVTCNEASSSA